jgi:hypothetical protein
MLEVRKAWGKGENLPAGRALAFPLKSSARERAGESKRRRYSPSAIRKG